MGLLEAHDDIYKRLEDHQEDAGAVGITLVNALQELEHITGPLLGYDYSSQLAVKRLDIFPLLLRCMKVFATELDELVRDATKSVSEIKPRYVSSSLPFLGVLDDLLELFNKQH